MTYSIQFVAIIPNKLYHLCYVVCIFFNRRIATQSIQFVEIIRNKLCCLCYVLCTFFFFFYWRVSTFISFSIYFKIYLPGIPAVASATLIGISPSQDVEHCWCFSFTLNTFLFSGCCCCLPCNVFVNILCWINKISVWIEIGIITYMT